MIAYFKALYQYKIFVDIKIFCKKTRIKQDNIAVFK